MKSYFCFSLLLFLLGTTVQFSKADDVYLKTGFIVRNVQIIDTIFEGEEKFLLTNSNVRERKFPLKYVVKIILKPFDLSIESKTVAIEDSAESAVNEVDSRIKNSILKDTSDIKNKEYTRRNLLDVKTITGENIIGELETSNDSTVTYKTSYGLVTMMKKNILSVNKSRPYSNINSDNNIPTNLNSIQKQEYARRRLSIELEGIGVGTSSGTNIFTSSVIMTQYQSWRKWKASEGFTKITEGEFFVKTGYQKESQLAKEYYKSQKSGMTAGYFLAILGIGLNYFGWVNKETTETFGYKYETPKPNYFLIAGGSLATIIGGTLIYSGSVGLNMNWSSYSTVQGIAEEYNNKLLESMDK
jgi:hypothetical protein